MIDISVSGISSTTKILAKVELYEGSTLVRTCTCSDSLKQFTVERYGEDGKFFGTCIGQKLKAEFIDLWREIEITNGQYMKVAYIIGDTTIYPYPTFYVNEVSRDENDNNITVVAYDVVCGSEALTVADLTLPTDEGYKALDVLEACAAALGCSVTYKNITSDNTALQIAYPNGANFDGSETVRSVLTALAEITQTICYVAAPGEEGQQDRLVFQRLDKDSDPDYTINRNRYYKLKTEAARTIGQICHATELGNNITSSLLAEGNEIQYIRNNPFLDTLDGNAVADFLEYHALPAIGGLSIVPFHCEWVGDCRLEPGDKLALVCEDGSTAISYLLDNVVTFDGICEEVTEWTYAVDEAETDANPTSLGDVLNKTFARVDKQAQEITLAINTANDNTSSITALRADVDSITATVSETSESLNDIGDAVGILTKSVEAKMSAEDVTIAINRRLEEGLETSVTPTAGFTFNQDGLRIETSEAATSTLIDADGMTVSDSSTGETRLEADSEGVWAANLHATTYLTIGNNSRLENYESGRTACYWIGG